MHGYSGACKTEVCTEPTGVREEETRIPHVWKEQGTRWAKKPFLLGKGCWRLSGNHIGGERCLGCGWYAAPYGPHVVGPGPVSLPPEWCCFIYSSLSYRPQATLGLHHLPQLLRRLRASAPAFSLSPPPPTILHVANLIIPLAAEDASMAGRQRRFIRKLIKLEVHWHRPLPAF